MSSSDEDLTELRELIIEAAPTLTIAWRRSTRRCRTCRKLIVQITVTVTWDGDPDPDQPYVLTGRACDRCAREHGVLTRVRRIRVRAELRAAIRRRERMAP